VLTFVNTSALSSSTIAARRARVNIANNLPALAATTQEIALPELCNIAEFLIGRDGSLTAKDTSNQWISSSSLPFRVAQEILLKLEITVVAGCMVAPTHAAQIRAALEKLPAHQAIIAIIPSLDDVTQLLHCEDFSHEIARHRLWFAAGDNWKNALAELFQNQPGLPTPTQFIRLPLVAAEISDAVIAEAQPVFAEIHRTRHEGARAIAWRPARGAKRTIAVVAPSHFRLWNDKGDALRRLFDGTESQDIAIVHVDPDDPASACPLDLPRRLSRCDAIVTADIARADLPSLLSSDMPWITWLTTARVPLVASAGLHDHLLLANPTVALQEGWPSHRVHRATWPTMVAAFSGERPQALAIVADTFSLDTPEDLNQFSSHRVLWDTLKAEISNNPFVVGTDPQAYLLNRLKQVGFAVDNFPVVRFLSQLVYPAVAQSIAAMLIHAKLPLKLYGGGWDDIATLASHSAGPVSNRKQFEAVIQQPIAVVDVWPGIAAHPVRSVGVPILRLDGNGRESFLRSASQILTAPPPAGALPPRTLSLSIFREILSTLPA